MGNVLDTVPQTLFQAAAEFLGDMLDADEDFVGVSVFALRSSFFVCWKVGHSLVSLFRYFVLRLTSVLSKVFDEGADLGVGFAR